MRNFCQGLLIQLCVPYSPLLPFSAPAPCLHLPLVFSNSSHSSHCRWLMVTLCRWALIIELIRCVTWGLSHIKQETGGSISLLHRDGLKYLCPFNLCVCTGAHTCVYGYVLMEARGQSWVSLLGQPPPWFWIQGFPLGPETCWLGQADWPVSQRDSPAPAFLPRFLYCPSCDGHFCTSTQFPPGVAPWQATRNQLRFSWVHSKHFKERGTPRLGP